MVATLSEAVAVVTAATRGCGRAIAVELGRRGATVVHNAIDTHLIALHRLLPLVITRPGGLVIEVTDGDTDGYTGAGLPYFLSKSGIRAIGRALGAELARYGCTGLAVTPGFLRSEAMLDYFGVTEQTWPDAAGTTAPPDFAVSETPGYLGRGVAALAADPDVSRFAGQTLASWTLMREYGFTDSDGSRPDFGRWLAEVRDAGMDPAAADPGRFR